MASVAQPVYPLRVWLGIGAAALLPLLASLDFYRSLVQAGSSAQDPYQISRQEERFREARGMLPTGAVIGYLSDLPFEEPRGSAAFFSAQYALAPRLLVAYQYPFRQEWVIGNFSQQVDLGKIQRDNHVTLARDFGAGVALFRKEAR